MRRRDSRSSDSEHDERSTEDDERSLLRNSPRTRLPPPPPDDEPPSLKPREFFERLQSQAMREAQERKHRRDLPLQESHFTPVDVDGSLGDSLSQVSGSLFYLFHEDESLLLTTVQVQTFFNVWY